MNLRTSSSDISAFLSCRRNWALSRNWQVAEFQEPLTMGSFIHLYLENYYRIVQKEGYTRDPESLLSETKSLVNPILYKIWEEDFKPFYGPAFGGKLSEVARQAQAVFETYVHIDPFRLRDWMIKDVEVKVEIPIFDHVFVGKIDLILEDPIGNLYIVDHKTKKSFSRMDGLEVDFQMTAYAALVEHLYGKKPTEILYNLILRDPPQEPARLTPTSALPIRFSKGKDQPTTGAMYRAALKANGLSEIGYEDILSYYDQMGSSKFNQIVGTTRNDREITNFMDYLVWGIVPEMALAFENPAKIYPNPSTASCSWCPFLEICKSMNDGGDWESTLKSPRYRPVEPRPVKKD